MNAPKRDPTYIKNKDRYFMQIAKTIASASTHPKFPGGCVLVRDREIIGTGRSILCSSKVEIDCLTYAIGVSSKRGTPTVGAVVYSTRYPFSASVFQCYLMGIKRICFMPHEWEAYYKDEFRRAARLARELELAIEPIYEKSDPRFSKNSSIDDGIEEQPSISNDFKFDEYDPQEKGEIYDEEVPI
tara:strand:+ start:6154 stop:6711 length:558 start_codon:yes stop_codon:yes gene_type:complete